MLPEQKRRLDVHVGDDILKKTLTFRLNEPQTWDTVIQKVLSLKAGHRAESEQNISVEELRAHFEFFFREGACSAPKTCVMRERCFVRDRCFVKSEDFLEIDQKPFHAKVTDLLIVPKKNFNHIFGQQAIGIAESLVSKALDQKNMKIRDFCKAEVLLVKREEGEESNPVFAEFRKSFEFVLGKKRDFAVRSVVFNSSTFAQELASRPKSCSSSTSSRDWKPSEMRSGKRKWCFSRLKGSWAKR